MTATRQARNFRTARRRRTRHQENVQRQHERVDAIKHDPETVSGQAKMPIAKEPTGYLSSLTSTLHSLWSLGPTGWWRGKTE